MKDLPVYLVKALQGVAYWMGYRSSLFSSYHLSESALVTETCNLIYANLDNQKCLIPEVKYKYIVPPNASFASVAGLKPDWRADLVVGAKRNGKALPRGTSIFPECEHVFEVKKANSAYISDDLVRLARFMELHQGTVPRRGFLLIFSENKVPTKFVSKETAHGLRGKTNISGTNCFYRIRKVLKAFDGIPKGLGQKDRKAAFRRGHYAIILEVFLSTSRSRSSGGGINGDDS